MLTIRRQVSQNSNASGKEERSYMPSCRAEFLKLYCTHESFRDFVNMRFLIQWVLGKI